MLSVTELNEQAKALLETSFGYIEVRGEVSRLTRHASGHWYFVLKDEGASVSAAMFKGANQKVSFEIKEGTKVVAYAKVSMYAPSGSYQLIVSALRPDGEGELEKALNELKNRLRLMGLFEPSRKKPLPSLVSDIAIITSATSAALADMLKVASERWQMLSITVYDSLTQGATAPESLINALQKADSAGHDAIILARGGGSKEDLWCFNDEALAVAISNLKTPIITGIGHEIDESVADLVADVRAPTPTAAMMTLLPDAVAVAQYVDRLDSDISSAFGARLERLSLGLNKFDFDSALRLKLARSEAMLGSLKARFMPEALNSRLDLKLKDVSALSLRFDEVLSRRVLALSSKLAGLMASFETYESFYAASADLVELRDSNGKKLNLNALKQGDEIRLIGQNASKIAIIKE